MMHTIQRLALGLGLLTSVVVATDGAAEQRALPEVLASAGARQTVLSYREADKGLDGMVTAAWGGVAFLPPDASRCTVTLRDVAGKDLEVPARILGRMRGLPVAQWTVPAGFDIDRAVIVHDGDWRDSATFALRRRSRDFDTALSATVPGLKGGQLPFSGAYVIIAAPDFMAAAAPLAAWKRAKGYETLLVSTSMTGATNTEIQAWLRDIYAHAEIPPEYVLLLGDVDTIPAWSFSENVTDLPYAMMDDDDWLPDLMVGRLPAANAYEAETMINKTIAYERSPAVADDGWFSRQLMVGGNYSSTTPVQTVRWVGQQMQTVGFEPATEVFYPPYWNGVYFVTQALNQGAGLCVYRGWAYGTSGWEPPHFTVADIPGVDNGAMTPVVMSFVCLNGNFASADPCFGEVFVRQGTPTEPKGAVAFIGNGEHWSHTRYNDAMAISFFETATDTALTTLGGMMNAGKLRFIQYFPHEMDAATFGEESVEFYYHIYNLLGDPELNFWKGTPRHMDIEIPMSLSSHETRLDLTASEQGRGSALRGARVGIVGGGVLLASGWTGADGELSLDLGAWNGQDDLLVTVTAPGHYAWQRTLNPVAVSSFVAVEDPPAGQRQVVPGQTVHLYPTVTNEAAATATDLVLNVDPVGAASVVADELTLASLDGGESHTFSGPDFISFTVPADAAAGDVIDVRSRVSHDGAEDLSSFPLTIKAPELVAASHVPDGGGVLLPGRETEVEFVIANHGSLATTGGTITPELLTPDVGTVDDGSLSLGPLAAYSGSSNQLGFNVTTADDLPAGTGLLIRLNIDTDEGYVQTAMISLTIGRVDAGAPVGPDDYGYWALDSADLDYPALAPVYRWTELDPALGGDGVEVPFTVDNEVVTRALPFPFTYYGTSYAGEIRITENGWISFDACDDYEFYNWPLPNKHGCASVLAPFWDNFDPMLAGTGGVFTKYDEAAGTFTIEWSAMRHYRPEITDAQTFQLVLRDPLHFPTPTGDGEVLFLYRQALNTDYLRQYATVGWEDDSETDGCQLSYANISVPGMAPIGPGLAVLLTTATPVRVPYAAAAFSARRSVGGVELKWEIEDSRPVVGWCLERIAASGADNITASLLSPETRTYLDSEAPKDTDLSYRLVAVHPYNHRNTAALAPVTASGAETLVSFALDPAHPNPAPGAVNLSFALPSAGEASLRVYDVAGRLVRELRAGDASAGRDLVIWDGRRGNGRPAATGVYFARLEFGQRTLTRKIMLVR